MKALKKKIDTMKIAQNRKFIMRKKKAAGSEVRVGGTDKTICAIIATSLDTGQKTAGRRKLMRKAAPPSNNPGTWEAWDKEVNLEEIFHHDIKRPEIQLTVLGQIYWFLVDTGASRIVIRDNAHGLPKLGETVKICSANGHLGYCPLCKRRTKSPKDKGNLSNRSWR